MLPREVIRRIRQLRIRASRAVQDLLGGKYHSIFKGMGIAFEEVREYQPGDDIRSIDWNVTARMWHPYVKRFIEERELTVLLAVDVSGSLQFGAGLQRKHEVAAELAAILAFSAVSNNDRVGLIAFTDRVERFLPPRKGARHVLRLIRDLLFFQPERKRTSIRQALDYLNRVQRRRAIVFLLSDFADRGFERVLKQTSRRHELIALSVSDEREESLPNVGLVEVCDAETGLRRVLDTSSRRVREAYAQASRDRREELRRLFQSARVDLVETVTDGRHLDRLVQFFRTRERRLRIRGQ